MDETAMGVATVFELRNIDDEDVGMIEHLAVSHLGREVFTIDAYEKGRGGVGRYRDGRQYHFTSLKDLASDLERRYEM